VSEYYQQHSLAAPASIVDMGCSTGISTRWFRKMNPQADIVGLDLSPYFLAVAQLEEQCGAAAGNQQKAIRCAVGWPWDSSCWVQCLHDGGVLSGRIEVVICLWPHVQAWMMRCIVMLFEARSLVPCRL
jgi:hypothetical protein